MKEPLSHELRMSLREHNADYQDGYAAGAAAVFGLVAMATGIREGGFGHPSTCPECRCPNLLHYVGCKRAGDGAWYVRAPTGETT